MADRLGHDSAPPPDAEEEAGRCRRCGAAYRPLQEYCLECGLRLSRARTGMPTRRRARRYAGGWIWPALAALVIAVLGATVAILASEDERSGAGETIVATTRIVPRAAGAPPVAGAEPVGTPGTPAPKVPSAPQRSAPKAVSHGGLATWPSGRTGYTVVLASLPASGGRAAAAREAKAASKAGLPAAGILDSSQFSSLHPGYYVVFSGIYGSLEDAQSATSTASRHFPRAYAREITP